MASLFDLAAELGGFDDRRAPPTTSETALGILDDALQSLYGASHGRAAFSASSPALLAPSAAVPSDTLVVKVSPATTASVSCRALAPAKSASCLSDRLDQLMDRERAANCPDADREARSVLRELGEEVELLRMRRPSSDNNKSSADSGVMDADQVAALLTHKYIVQRLDALPGTPFVLLARRKTRLKIDQLRLALEQPRSKSVEAKAVASRVRPESLGPPASSDASSKDDEWWRRVDEMLALPESHLRRLPAAQRELAAFAKRLDALLRLPDAHLRRLPPEHQRVLEALRQRWQQQA